MSLVLTDIQKVTLSVAFVDKAGNPAKTDGAPVWSSSATNIATVTPATDGLSAVVETVGPLGSAQIQVSADADLGEEVKTISGTLDIEVTGSEAVSIVVNAGTPEDK